MLDWSYSNVKWRHYKPVGYYSGFQPVDCGPLVVRRGIAGGPWKAFQLKKIKIKKYIIMKDYLKGLNG